MEIMNICKIPYGFLNVCYDLGYFTRVNQFMLKSNYIKFEPIHSRKLIEAYNEKHRLNQIKWKKKKEKEQEREIKKFNKQVEKHFSPEIKETVKEKVIKKPKRVFSLFWGLIKFNY